MRLTQSIKNILKHFLPPPIHSFNREIKRVLLAVDRTQQEVATLNKEQGTLMHGLKEQLSLLTQVSADINKTLELQKTALEKQKTTIETNWSQSEMERKTQTLQLQQDIKQVGQAIPNRPVFWSDAFERRVVQENWGDVTEGPDFAQKFLRLTAGMDPKSIECIVRILARQKKYLHSNQNSLDLFTRQEQEELRLLNENFYSEILKLSDDLYAYKNYLLPINHFESSVFYYKHGLSQVKTLNQVKGKSIVDVGGFVGDSVLVFSELSPSNIYTFEAVPANFKLLKKTMEINHIQNVVAENVALGAEAGTITMHIDGPGSTPIERPGLDYKGDIKVPAITLDDYVAKHKFDIGLIKVDIEGGEPAFLTGAKQTICEQKPILLLSIYHNAHDFFELKPLIESWNLGYKFSIHKPTYGNITSETLLLAEIE